MISCNIALTNRGFLPIDVLILKGALVLESSVQLQASNNLCAVIYISEKRRKWKIHKVE